MHFKLIFWPNVFLRHFGSTAKHLDTTALKFLNKEEVDIKGIYLWNSATKLKIYSFIVSSYFKRGNLHKWHTGVPAGTSIWSGAGSNSAPFVLWRLTSGKFLQANEEEWNQNIISRESWVWISVECYPEESCLSPLGLRGTENRPSPDAGRFRDRSGQEEGSAATRTPPAGREPATSLVPVTTVLHS